MNAQEAARILAKENDSVVVVGISRKEISKSREIFCKFANLW